MKSDDNRAILWHSGLMTEVNFYHMTSTPLERALPLLMVKVLDNGLKALVVASSDERVSQLNQSLWTYPQWAFIPHGIKEDGDPKDHPIFLSTEEKNVNDADVLVLTDGRLEASSMAAFKKCLILFDGQDEAVVSSARQVWKKLKDQGVNLKYFSQKDDGGWELKAQ